MMKRSSLRRSSSNTLYRVEMRYGTFGIIVTDGIVVQAAPIGNWMIGKTLTHVREWVERKGCRVVLVP